LDYGKHNLTSTPDRPYSLFEGKILLLKRQNLIDRILGLAGTIYYMADMLNPTHARFPAFE